MITPVNGGYGQNRSSRAWCWSFDVDASRAAEPKNCYRSGRSPAPFGLTAAPALFILRLLQSISQLNGGPLTLERVRWSGCLLDEGSTSTEAPHDIATAQFSNNAHIGRIVSICQNPLESQSWPYVNGPLCGASLLWVQRVVRFVLEHILLITWLNRFLTFVSLLFQYWTFFYSPIVLCFLGFTRISVHYRIILMARITLIRYDCPRCHQ